MLIVTSALAAISVTYTADDSKKPAEPLHTSYKSLEVHPVFKVGPIELPTKSFLVGLNPGDTWRVFADQIQAKVEKAYVGQNYELKTIAILGSNFDPLEHLDEPVQDVTDAIEATFHEQPKSQFIKG